MKVLVIGDSHGSISNIHHVMGFAKKIKADAIIHTGDWDNKEAVKTVFEYEIPVYTILGNADLDIVAEDSKDFVKKALSDFTHTKINLGGRSIGIIHSFKVTDDWYRNLDIVFSGHRHSQDSRIVNGVKIVRPGALVNGISFAVYDTDSNSVEFMEL